MRAEIQGGAPPPAGRRRLGLLLSCVLLLPGAAQAVSGSEESPPESAAAPAATQDSDALAPKLSLHGFGDVNAVWEQDRLEGGGRIDESRFELGALNLFIVSHLAENISFLSEIVFESAGTGEEESKFEVERFTIRYRVSDLLFVSLGRHHTPLGYWNETFHHGRVLQPTVDRPEVLKWEDRGGILPVHSIGAIVGGRWFRRSWGLDYEAALWNGRGATTDHIQAYEDQNDSKAVTLRLTFSREKEGRILFGPMIDLDRIPPNPGVPGREVEMDERILGGHMVYQDERFELFSEGYRVHHATAGGGPRFNHTGYFAILVYRPHKLKPYAGYDRLNLDPADPYFMGINTDLKRFLAGLRWDLHPASAFKFEYNRDERPGITSHVFTTQAGFTF